MFKQDTSKNTTSKKTDTSKKLSEKVDSNTKFSGIKHDKSRKNTEIDLNNIKTE